MALHLSGNCNIKQHQKQDSVHAGGSGNTERTRNMTFNQFIKVNEVLFLNKTRRRVMEKTPISRVSNCYFYNCCIPGNLLESEVNTEHVSE